MSGVCLLTIEDGRTAYHDRSRASLREMLPDVDHHVEVDDREHRLGFGGAIREGWRRALATGCDWLLAVELDFTFRRPVPLADMIAMLDAHPHLVQMALLRQPWNSAERAAGGIIQLRPETYVQREWNGHEFIEHRNFTTTNCAVWPRWVVERGWPSGPMSEGRFGIALFAEDPAYRAAFWGDGAVWIDHIGEVRSGHSY